MSYSLPLQQLLKSVLKEAPIVEPTLWLEIYNQLRSDRIGFLRGNHVSFMKHAPQSIIGQLVELYELAIEEDVLCSKTNQVPWSVGISTIDALETIWETYVGKPCEPILKLMFISLMRITLHLENSGYGGFKSFKQKWQQLQSWMDDGYVADVAAITMSCLARMGKSFLQKMPIKTKKWLYKESEALYTADILDPAMWDEKQKQYCLVELSRAVIADNDLDETFKQSFRQHLEGTKMATKLEKDKTVIREVAVTDSQGNDGAINVTISTEGITIRGKGTQREVKIGYTDLVAASASPDNMPAKFGGDKMSWLLNKAATPKKDGIPGDV